jgi:hypothetical protein
MFRFATRALPLAVALLLPGTARAQREQLSLRIEQFGAVDVGTVRGSTRPIDYGLRQLTATVGVRTVRGRDDNTVLVNGLFYRRSDVGFSGVGSEERTLHALYYDFLALRTLDDRHTLAVALRPGLFGTLDYELGDQFRLEGAVFVDRLLTPRTTVGLGLSYTSNLGRVLPIPVVHIVHRRGRRVLIDGLLPSRLDLWYFPRKGIELGLNAQLSGFQYFIGEAPPRAPAAPPGGATFVMRNPELQLANAIIGPQVRWNATGKWFLSADAGVTVLRRYTFGTGRREAPLNPANTGVVRIGLQRMY